MRKRQPVLLVLACLFVVLGATARSQEPASNFWVYGPGKKSCGTYTSAADPSERLVMDVWMVGYVTGFGAGGFAFGVKLAETDSGAIRGYVVNYCQAHPLDSLAKAGSQLAIELMQRGNPR